MKWHVVYRRAVENGKLFFPEKLTLEFLESAKRTMGVYKFTNQYMNDVIPAELQTFRKEWIRYYDTVPKNLNHFIFVDPALSEADGSDFTAFVLVSVDSDNVWYVRQAIRYRLSPTQIVSKLFEWNEIYKPNIIGIEEVAYQKALLYFLSDEMRRRKVVLPVTGIRPPTDRTKQARILGLVPRIEWGRMLFARGLHDLEQEMMLFPRAAHDDLIDALASIEYIHYVPKEEDVLAHTLNQNHPEYEKRYIQRIKEGRTYEKEDNEF